MLGFQEPLDCRTSYSGVLDLRTVRADSSAGSWSSDGPPSPSDCRLPSPHDRMTGSPNDCHLRGRSPNDLCSSRRACPVLTPPRDSSMSPPMIDVVSPTLAITQRVLAAATAPQGTRPFKAYPKDPLSLSAQSDAYLQFRQHMLNQVRSAKQTIIRKRPASPVSPASGLINPQQPTSSGHDSSDDKDAAYWERRRKNNEAAKRSRDARRAKEDEIAIRAAFLEQENLRLKYQVAALTDETQKLRCLLYKSEGHLTGTV